MNRTASPPIVALLGAALLGVLGGAACGGRYKSTEAASAPEACCTWSDPELKNFRGCRVGGRHCTRGEIYWMQGAVRCGPVDEANCDGGRCCHYEPRYRPGLGQPGPQTTPPEDPAAPPSEPPAPTPDDTTEDLTTTPDDTTASTAPTED